MTPIHLEDFANPNEPKIMLQFCGKSYCWVVLGMYAMRSGICLPTCFLSLLMFRDMYYLSYTLQSSFNWCFNLYTIICDTKTNGIVLMLYIKHVVMLKCWKSYAYHVKAILNKGSVSDAHTMRCPCNICSVYAYWDILRVKAHLYYMSYFSLYAPPTTMLILSCGSIAHVIIVI